MHTSPLFRYRHVTLLACWVVVLTAPLFAQQPPAHPQCITLDAAIEHSRRCDQVGTRPLDLYLLAWRGSLDAESWQPTESQLQEVETIAKNHVQNSTGPQSDADTASVEYMCAKTRKISSAERATQASNALFASLPNRCFDSFTFSTDRPRITRTLDELKVLAVEADCQVKSLRHAITSINDQIACACNALANARLAKRREALAAEIASLKCQLAQRTAELNNATVAVQQKVDNLYERFMKADTALTDLLALYPVVTSRAVTTSTQKYREGTGSIDKCFDSVERHRKSAGNANATLITTWHLHSELKLLICTSP